ncbi:MAG: hypothetical protein PHI53_01140 [Candidatus Pacebacteria bacterium]|nr:hypothetical protein [Candidatus Paceibacterota bacterium]
MAETWPDETAEDNCPVLKVKVYVRPSSVGEASTYRQTLSQRECLPRNKPGARKEINKRIKHYRKMAEKELPLFPE